MNSKMLTKLKAYAGVATGLLSQSKSFLEGGRRESSPPPIKIMLAPQNTKTVLMEKLYYMQEGGGGFKKIMYIICPLLIFNALQSHFNS